MSVARIAKRYAKSLIELAIEKEAIEEVFNDVSVFLEASKNRDLTLLLKSPVIKSDKKQKVMTAIFGDKFHKITNAFVRIILIKGRERYLKEVAEEFVEQYKKHKHISSVTLTTASALGEKLVGQIKQTLTDSSATEDNVELETKVDPELIGGFVLEFEGKLYNASLAHKVEQLRKEFSINEYIKNM